MFLGLFKCPTQLDAPECFTKRKMPRFYCDYCDIYLTHDSSRVRKDHNNGWKHKMHVQNYYGELDGVKIQNIINSITKEYVYAGLGGFPELPGFGGGGGGGQHQPEQRMPVGKPQQQQHQPIAFNPAILASLPPPPGFKIPMGANGLPSFPPPPPSLMMNANMPPMMPIPGMPMPAGMRFPPPPPPQ